MAFPAEAAKVAERTCVVCGNAFMPKNDQARTCGRVCGGKARFSSPPVPRPVCRRCGEPRVGQLPGTGLCSRCWLAHGSLQAELRTLGLLGHKHIPVQYLRASITQRRALLAGILDTDGTVTSTGSVQLAVTNQRLAEGVRELVLSLGYRCSMTTKRVKGRHEESSTCYMVNFTTAGRGLPPAPQGSGAPGAAAPPSAAHPLEVHRGRAAGAVRAGPVRAGGQR